MGLSEAARMQKKVYKNEVYYADLEPVIGSEQGGTRPVLILQNDIGNKHSPTTIVAAITTRTGKKVHQPTHVHIDCPGLARNSIVLLEQIRTIDKTRLRQKLGIVPEDNAEKINKALLISLGFTGITTLS